MDLVAPKKILLRLLGRCQGVADKRSTMPVLANLLLTATNDDGVGKLEVAATDMFVSVAGAIEAEVSKAGSATVPARDFFERVKHMPDGPVHLKVDSNAVTTIKAVGSARRYTLHGLPGDDFPALPTPAEDAPRLDLPVATMSQLIARTHFSISTDETRAHLNSALFECGENVVRMVTTDGHRLSKMELPVEGLTATATMLIPLKAITELRKLLDEVSDGRDTTMVHITQTGPNAFFSVNDIAFSVKLIDAQFPPYDAVIPAVTDRAVRTPRVLLSDALKAVALAASDRTGGVKLSVSDNTLRITSESPESGNGFDEVAIDYQGPEISVGFNARYLLDVLGAIDEEEVTIGLSGELDPAVLRPASDEHNEGYIAVVMPMRI